MQTKKIKRCNFWVEAFRRKEKSAQTVTVNNQYKKINMSLLLMRYLKKKMNKDKLFQ